MSPSILSPRILGLLLLLAFGCREALEPTPPRVVSLSPAGSRALLALGAGEAVVAVGRGSRALAPFAELPEADFGSLESHRPTLVLVPPAPRGLGLPLESLRQRGIRVVEIDPHGFDEALAVYRSLASALELEQAALAPIRARADALAWISVEALGHPRPRVAPLVSTDPLVLAGGHSLVSDLLETVGADTVTHGTEAARVPTSVTDLAASAPDWILVATPLPLGASARGRLERLLSPLARVVFLPIDPDELWLGDPLPLARALRAELQLDAGTASAGREP